MTYNTSRKSRGRKKRRKKKKGLSLVIFLFFLILSLAGLKAISEHTVPDWLADISSRTELSEKLADSAGSFLDNISPYIQEIRDTAGSFLESASSSPKETPAPPDENGYFRIYFLDVGQGLSILIEADGQYLLYDGGDRDASSFVVAWLKQKGIEHLDYLIASHYDADHINGLVGALKTVTADTVIGPDYTAQSKVYQSFVTAVSEQGKSIVTPVPGDRYLLGEGYFDVLAPLSDSYSDANDYSVVLRFVYGETSVLLTGDAEAESELEMLEKWPALQSDILCVGHHGSPTSSSDEFLDRVSPSFAVISCGKNNSYGHPAASVLERLSSRNIQIFRTDENGTITVEGTAESFQILPEKESTACLSPIPDIRKLSAYAGCFLFSRHFFARISFSPIF